MMHSLSNFLHAQHPTLILYAWSMLRIAIGIIIARYGAPNLMGGYATWTFLGSAMQHFGITLWPALWGFLAACTQLFGGILLIGGIGTRLTSAPLIFTMLVALAMHLSKGDTFQTYGPALTLFIIFVAFFIGGSGPLSYDAWQQ